MLTAPSWYVEQWKDTALDVYQAGGFALRNTTTTPVKIDGKNMHFPIAGTLGAEEDVQTGDEAVPQGSADDEAIVTTKKSRCFTEVFEDDLDQLSVEQRALKSRQSARALGRVHDRTIVKELRTATTSIGANTTPFDLGQLLQAKQILQSKDVDTSQEQVFAALDSVSWNRALGFKHFSSQDYVGPDIPFVKKGDAKTWNGIHVFQLSDSILRFYETVGTQATSLVWAQSAIGFGYVRQLTGTVDWDNRKDCWTHNLRMRIGSKKLLDPGIVKIVVRYQASDVVITS
jgi:Phage capsid protein